MKTCANCLKKDLVIYIDTKEIILENNQILVINNIPAIKCNDCNAIYHGSEAIKYIDQQIAIFKAEGFHNRSKEVTKQKGITQEELGNMIGVTKQRINQIFKDDNLDVKTMYKIANAIDEPIQNVFSFNRITQKDSKFYIENE